MHLDSNKLSYIEPHAFDKLYSLITVQLDKNKCIDSTFYRKTQLLSIPGIVGLKCSQRLSPFEQAQVNDIVAKTLQLDQKNKETLALSATLKELRDSIVKSDQAKKLQLQQKDNEILALSGTLNKLRDSTVTSDQAKKLQLEQKDNEILDLKATAEKLRDSIVKSDQAQKLQLDQKDDEILKLKNTLAANTQEITTLKTLQSHQLLMNETFSFLTNQITDKDRQLLHLSTKLELMSRKLEGKDNAINYLKNQAAILQSCQTSE